MNAHIEKQLGRVQSSQTFNAKNSARVKVRGSSSRIGLEDSERTQNPDELDELRAW